MNEADTEKHIHQMEKGNKVLWWVMGIIATLLGIGVNITVTNWANRLSSLELNMSSRSERLRTLEVQFTEWDRYSTIREAELKLWQGKVDRKLDEINAKVTKQ